MKIILIRRWHDRPTIRGYSCEPLRVGPGGSGGARCRFEPAARRETPRGLRGRGCRTLSIRGVCGYPTGRVCLYMYEYPAVGTCRRLGKEFIRIRGARGESRAAALTHPN